MDRVRVSSEREGRGGGRECIIALTTRTSALLEHVDHFDEAVQGELAVDGTAGAVPSEGADAARHGGVNLRQGVLPDGRAEVRRL